MTDLITRTDLRAAIDAGDVLVIDALGGDYWAARHLPGAIPLPPNEVADRAEAVLPDRDAAIVTYCSNPACANSKQVAAALESLGYRDVRVYREGIEDWVDAGLPVETGERVSVR